MKIHQLIALFPIIFSLCSAAHAAGFQLAGHSVTQIGWANAGSSLTGDDASAAFENPAEMVLLTHDHFQLGVNQSRISFPFTNTGSTQNLLGTNIPSTGIESDGGTAANIPSILIVFSQDEALKYGLAITAPFGFKDSGTAIG